MLAIQLRRGSENAQSMATRGLPATSSGAATIIKSSCCVMCATNSPSLSASSGETSAKSRVTIPAAKQFTCQTRMPQKVPARCQMRRVPRAYR
jgi:hypothetical protein